MSYACFLQLLKVVQDSLTERTLVIAKLGIFVFQINSLRFNMPIPCIRLNPRSFGLVCTLALTTTWLAPSSWNVVSSSSMKVALRPLGGNRSRALRRRFVIGLGLPL